MLRCNNSLPMCSNGYAVTWSNTLLDLVYLGGRSRLQKQLKNTMPLFAKI
jgi:hypothetical protein